MLDINKIMEDYIKDWKSEERLKQFESGEPIARITYAEECRITYQR